jgi:regulator of protease activity HflC (stomatin/prohibitin superfamily)
MPGIGSLTREVIAQYTAEQVYSTARQEIQDKIRNLVEARLSEKMMEHEDDEESYRVSMRDTFILYDILVAGIELPAAIVGAINRKTEQYYIAEEYKFRVEREKRESEDRGGRHTRFSTDRQPRHLGVLPALARHRSDASAFAIHECESRRHRQRQRRLADHPRQCG